MLAREIMHAPVITVPPETSVSAAYGVLQHHKIRHLPVVEQGLPVGIVTDRDLRLATSSLCEHPSALDVPVREVMTQEPITAGPLDPIEECARVMYDRKIGCLPVLEGDRLIGIITGPDLLDALIHLTGINHPSGRLAVALDQPGDLARLATLLDEMGIRVHSILTYPEAEEHPYVIVRVDTLNTRTPAQRLRESGFRVLWPAAKEWSR